MRASKSILAILVLVFSAMPALALFAGWQKRGGQPPNPSSRSAAPPANAQNSGNSYQFQPKGPGPHRGDWLRKYGNLPPTEQEQQLRQDPGFRNLPPDRQNQLLDRLRNFNSQPPQKKAQILDRMETFEHMTPAAAGERPQLVPAVPQPSGRPEEQDFASLPPVARNAAGCAQSTAEFRPVPQ